MPKSFYFLVTLIAFLYTVNSGAQNYDDRYNSDIVPSYWQQKVSYKMTIDMDVDTYRYSGEQELIYTNNSPDTLKQVFYHLYPNAFQPGSEMDERLKSIEDPDWRMVNNLGTKEEPIYESRIAKLSETEIGYINVNKLKQDGKEVKNEVQGTILMATLNKPILPGASTKFTMNFDAQVPVQIRRSGRENREGVALSMSQWYPKLAEYDNEGWHADPYISREFYGVWGDYDVTIKIDKNFTVAGTGYLQNPNEIGHGYQDEGAIVKSTGDNKLKWHFSAPNVHDFTWAADDEYLHDKLKMENGPTLHFFYKNNPDIIENWKALQPLTADLMTYFSKHVGKYPYKQYSVIQGGDGGMEYAMCTLITGQRRFGSLLGVTAHELAHTWFQFLLGTNELLYGWMDEGFTDYISTYALDEINAKNEVNPITRSYGSYLKLVDKGYEQPLATNADRFSRNGAYSVYNKGAVFLGQLGYIIGKDALDRTLKSYFKHWAFKHPKPIDFIRIAEKESGLQLKWYLQDWINTTFTVDYAISSVTKTDNNANKITLERKGEMMMPVDLVVNFEDGSKAEYTIPLRRMRGHKAVNSNVQVLEAWPWAQPNYTFHLNTTSKAIKSIAIDPDGFSADVDRENNSMEVEGSFKP